MRIASKIFGAQSFSAAWNGIRTSTELKKTFFIAPIAVALAALARLALEPVLLSRDPFLFFAIAVMLASLYGGAWAGVGATLLSIPICDYLFIEPRYTWFFDDAPDNLIVLAVFATLSLLTAIVVQRFHSTRRQLQQSLMELQRSESKLEMIAATVPEILFTASRNGAVEYFNGYLRDYSGREPQALVGYAWLDLVHPEDGEGIMSRFAMRSGALHEFEVNVRLRRFDGVYRWFKCRAKPVRDCGSTVEKWFGVYSDIDDEKTLTAALESRTEELLRLNDGLERFACTASHDLQEPLRTIGALTQLFLNRAGSNLDEESSRMLASVVKGVERMRRLIGDIMEFAKAGNLPKQADAVIDADAVAKLAIANLEQAVKESGAEILIAPLPLVYANQGALLRLFQNLIANAIKYCRDKPPQIHISAAERRIFGYDAWIFSVKDNGIGIERQHHKKIFEPFRRLHGQSEYEGSGLGLSACLRIVQSFNGSIWVESEPGEGSTFFFTIAKPSDSEDYRTEISALATPGREAWPAPPRAL
jgi:PAS domain S-box-containing protein